MSMPTGEDERNDQDTQAKRRAPRARRVPKTRAAQAKADAVAELFQPAPITIDQGVANIPFEARLAAWFGQHDWKPFPFQREVWKEILGALAAYIPEDTRSTTLPAPLTVLWITPMRALAADPPARCKPR